MRDFLQFHFTTCRAKSCSVCHGSSTGIDFFDAEEFGVEELLDDDGDLGSTGDDEELVADNGESVEDVVGSAKGIVEAVGSEVESTRGAVSELRANHGDNSAEAINICANRGMEGVNTTVTQAFMFTLLNSIRVMACDAEFVFHDKHF